MRPIGYTKKNLSRVEFFEKHLEIVTLFMPGDITKTQIKVLANFMALTGDVVEKYRFNSTARKIVMEKLGMSPGGLGNHLRDLKNINYIIEEDGKLRINKWLIPFNETYQSYNFKIISDEFKK